MDTRNFILKNFEIKKFKYGCNQPYCDKKPKNEIMLYEYIRKKKTGLAKLYLCEEHSDTKKLLSILRSIAPKMTIESKVMGR
jgi:hypothetical protein